MTHEKTTINGITLFFLGESIRARERILKRKKFVMEIFGGFCGFGREGESEILE